MGLLLTGVITIKPVKLVALLFVCIFIVSFVSTGMILSASAAEEVNDAEYEIFVDLIGSVNYTYYNDGSNYEGKTLSLFNQQPKQHQSINFALSIGYSNVFAWHLPDGSPAKNLDQIYRDNVAEPMVLFDRNADMQDMNNPMGA